MVITDNAAMEPVKEMSLDVFMANKPAMKNVLSPISETNTRENACEGREGRGGGKEGGEGGRFILALKCPRRSRFYSPFCTIIYLQET